MIIIHSNWLHGIHFTGGMMSIDRLIAQTANISDATVDKLLGSNFLSLALLALVMIVAMFLLFVWLTGKREKSNDQRQTTRQEADDKRQDTLIKLFTDDNSPLVKSAKAATSAIELSNQRSEDWKKSIDNLATKTDDQTSKIVTLISKTDEQTTGLRDFTNFQKTNNDQVAGLTDVVDTRFKSLEIITAELNTLVQGLPNKEYFEALSDTIKNEILEAIRSQAKRATGQLPVTVTVNNEATP